MNLFLPTSPRRPRPNFVFFYGKMWLSPQPVARSAHPPHFWTPPRGINIIKSAFSRRQQLPPLPPMTRLNFAICSQVGTKCASLSLDNRIMSSVRILLSTKTRKTTAFTAFKPQGKYPHLLSQVRPGLEPIFRDYYVFQHFKYLFHNVGKAYQPANSHLEVSAEVSEPACLGSLCK